MAAIDKRTATDFNVPFATLMEHAGVAVARFVTARFHPRRILVVCGTGNNGGDGLVAARVLAQLRKQVIVVLTGPQTRYAGVAADQLHALQRCTTTPWRLAGKPQAAQEIPEPVTCNVPVVELTENNAAETLNGFLDSADVVIDAVTGTGFKPPLRGIAVVVRDVLRAGKVPIVSVDLPTGWDADSREQTSSDAISSDAVVTFTAPKPAHLFGHLTRETFGPVFIASIGSPDAAIQSTENLTWTGTSKKLFEQPRNVDSNKGMYGHVLLVGGAAGKPGAPSMASLAALRTGAGLVTAAVAESILQTVARITPELMTTPLAEDGNGGLALSNADPETRDKLLRKISILAIGPGLGTEGDTPAFVRKLVTETTLPLVLDADGLNAFRDHADLIDGRNRTFVLTPHPGEMGTLLGIPTKAVQADRLNLARKFATEHHVTLVLKGWRTLVAHPDGRVAVNTTGNPSMAKGGSGDILTGIVAAAIAQFPDRVAEAVEAAVYLHGLAADFAAIERDEHTILATDTVAHLSNAFRYRTQDADGNEWISGVRGGIKA